MNNPHGVPADVWEKASSHIAKALSGHSKAHKSAHGLKLIVSHAIVAERAECAKIADDYAGLGLMPSPGAAYGDAALTTTDIAEDIRTRPIA